MFNLVTSARPYAKAVFALAQEQKKIFEWRQLLETASVVIQDKNMIACLKNPNFSAAKLSEILLNVCKQSLFSDAENFIKLLAARRRLLLLPEIFALFKDYLANLEKRVVVDVTSVMPLNDSEQQKLRAKLSQRLQREVQLNCKIDKKIIGGLIIQAEDLVIDASVRGKLTRLTHTLLS